MAVILIVEDDLFISQLAEMTLQDLGHETLMANDVGEAMTILRRPGHIDALFTDIYLKTAVLGGCEVADAALKLRPELRVLYTTGNTVTEKVRAMFAKGARCLAKPYTVEQLHDCVDDMLAA